MEELLMSRVGAGLVFRAAHLAPYIRVLREAGAPVERKLRRAGLPTTLSEEPDGYLPLLTALDFLATSEQDEGIHDLAARGAQGVQSVRLHQMLNAALLRAPTLYAALRALCTYGPLEAPCIDWWVDFDAPGAGFCGSLRVPREVHDRQYCEWHQNMALVALVRMFAGPDWCPREMTFSSSASVGRFAREQFPDTRFIAGHSNTRIGVPRGMMSLPPWAPRRDGPSRRAGLERVERATDFLSSLKLLLKTYLPDRSPTIQLAAEISGTSVRTLQRRLAAVGLSYSDVLDHVRFEAAAHMLRNPDIKMIEVAYELGYRDPSSFSRAFRRLAGISPREYRRQSPMEATSGAQATPVALRARQSPGQDVGGDHRLRLTASA
jgi:AraC-like DNA-binding protein